MARCFSSIPLEQDNLISPAIKQGGAWVGIPSPGGNACGAGGPRAASAPSAGSQILPTLPGAAGELPSSVLFSTSQQQRGGFQKAAARSHYCSRLLHFPGAMEFIRMWELRTSPWRNRLTYKLLTWRVGDRSANGACAKNSAWKQSKWLSSTIFL